MAARAMWKGVIRAGGKADVPVKLYSALEDKKVRFKLLHRTDQVPVRQALIDPVEEEPVPSQAVQKGLQVDESHFVVIEPAEVAELAPPKSRDIEVLRTIPPSALSDPWYDRPYWLGPDGDADAYFGLAQALAAEERVAIVRWVMRGKRYQGAMLERDGHLALIRLHHAEEMVPLDRLETPTGREPDARELKLAEQLVAALADAFDPQGYQDEYREQLSKLVEAKAKGKKLKPAKEPKRPRVASLQKALEQSLRAVQKGA